ncbi:phage holin family protein [Peribacillus acanthi]|uniref:phage holin family protein n=1 Tax=Peribacillus acanthi TaxID=2171554 RepID=UPI003B82CA5B
MDLQIVHSYLFGNVKFLDLLLLAMAIDIFTGVIKAWKEKKLRSRNAYFGYVRKIAVFGIIIAANIVDVILQLNGAIALSTVIFYLVNEILSITENAAQIGIKVPKIITDKLQVIQEEEKDENRKE